MAEYVVANAISFPHEWAESKYEEIIREGKTDDIQWRFEHLLRVLDEEKNDKSISYNAHDAHLRVKDAFVHHGIKGALAHVQWLISSLESCQNSSVYSAVQTLAIGLGLAT